MRFAGDGSNPRLRFPLPLSQWTPAIAVKPDDINGCRAVLTLLSVLSARSARSSEGARARLESQSANRPAEGKRDKMKKIHRAFLARKLAAFARCAERKRAEASQRIDSLFVQECDDPVRYLRECIVHSSMRFPALLSPRDHRRRRSRDKLKDIGPKDTNEEAPSELVPRARREEELRYCVQQPDFQTRGSRKRTVHKA